MTTHDSLAIRITGNSCYETRFQKMLSLLQTDPSLLRLFLDNPGPRLAGMGIPVMSSLEDVEFASAFPGGAYTGNELLQIKLHWWGVEASIGFTLIRYMKKSMETGGSPEQVISPSAKGSLQGDMIRTVCDELKRIVDSCFAPAYPAEKTYSWRVPWKQWSTGLPMELLLYFASRPLSC